MKQSGAFLLFMALSLFDCIETKSQSWTWSRNFGGQEYDQVHEVAIDSFGNSYITGSFTHSVSFGDVELQAQGKADLFLAKFDPQGNSLWAISAGGPGEDEGKHLCLDPEGFIYVTGTFSDNALFGDQLITSHGNLDIFLAKYNSEGNLVKVINAMGSASRDNVAGISHDPNGSIFVVGDYQAGVSQEDVFITNFDQKRLGLQWMQFAGGPGSQKAAGIVSDAQGNCFLTGSFGGTIYMGGASLKAVGSNDLFIAKFRNNGSEDWLKQVKVEGSAHNAGLSLDAMGNCYLSGSFDFSVYFEDVSISADGEREAFIAKYDQHGVLKWAKSSENHGYVNATAMHTTPQGFTYLAGSISGSQAFGTVNLSYTQEYRPYVVKVGSNGEFIWGTTHENVSSRNVSEIVADSKGNCWMTGKLYGENGIEGTAVLTSSREFDGFLSQLQEDQSCSNRDINLAVANTNTEGVTINWEGFSGMEYQYRYRMLPNGHWEPLVSTSMNEVTLTELQPESDYVFHVRGYCNGNLNNNVTIQFQTASPGSCASAPQNVRAINLTSSSATLIWETKNQVDLTGYQFRIRKPDGSWSRGFANDAYLELTGLDAGSTYEFIVTSSCLENRSKPTTVNFTTEVNAFANLQLAPNHEKNTLFITPSEPMLVRIYDSRQALKSEVYVHKHGMEISLSALEKGSYQVKGVHPLGTITRSLVKE
ncbi:MAG: SBBP repeat-containing protein [Cyclobacteriaceae bacterium]|nr:SBBP repeat-containing protein [Cyclobacteriaceae bacterium]